MLPLMLTIAVLTCACALTAPLVSVSARVDFGEDVGQNLGTLFEMKDDSGRVVAGAGFPGVYNTYGRNDRFQLQFFLRPAKAPEPAFEPLPKPSPRCGQYIFDLDGKVYAEGEKAPVYWDGQAWVSDSLSAVSTMRVADGLLSFANGAISYKGEQVLPSPAEGLYRNFYYAGGHLLFYHAKTGEGEFTRVMAVPWRPSTGPPSLETAKIVECKYAGETPFVWGQLDGKIITVSNLGGVYIFDGSQWSVLREALKGVSFQIYSSIAYHDKLLMAQYPTGNLFSYDGKELVHMPGTPPVMPGVSTGSREAQSTAIYGGDLYVGVWPWAELWRYEREQDRWHFVRRMFTHPELTNEWGHPYEADIRAYNEAHGTERVYNDWGQRLTSMAPWRDSLLLATSAKGTFDRDPAYGFLTDEVCAEYGRITRFRLPGVVWAAVKWQQAPTVLRCVVEEGKMRVEQDGRVIGEVAVGPEVLEGLKAGKLTWGEGAFGRAGMKVTAQ